MNLSCAPSRMYPYRFVKNHFKLTAIGFRYFDRLVHRTPIFGYNFYSTKGSWSPGSAQTSMSHHQQRLKRDRDLKKDKMLASRDPKAAAKNVPKQACCSLIGLQDAHANRSVETILDGIIQEMRKKTDENFKFIMKQYEAKGT